MKIGVRRLMNRLFLSTLSLRRATQQKSGDGKTNVNFYPRSPCGERQGTQLTVADVYKISIHALLAESDPAPVARGPDAHISIHALLAESDATEAATTANEALFLSTLSLRRATKHFAGAKLHDPDFYPRSPCGERPASVQTRLVSMSFLSTLSLRRATIFTACQATVRVFLSTLSLRRATAPQPSGQYDGLISIHALLAESD